MTACGVWLGRRGLAAVLADGGGRLRLAITVARTDAGRWGLVHRLAAVDAELVMRVRLTACKTADMTPES